ncbi:hypothetical protein AXF42_Ash014874 [Apostasia shenzhenica]|uniref:Uncharacterized protein n=1 Tax=Apostasia shenzhenica TaxID=1088818 RepID=A0A2I0ALE2_9ASPA|nr:hypothetical protein AXF42_Ash014874 [Apostasia shenzhenica]
MGTYKLISIVKSFQLGLPATCSRANGCSQVDGWVREQLRIAKCPASSHNGASKSPCAWVAAARC